MYWKLPNFYRLSFLFLLLGWLRTLYPPCLSVSLMRKATMKRIVNDPLMPALKKYLPVGFQGSHNYATVPTLCSSWQVSPLPSGHCRCMNTCRPSLHGSSGSSGPFAPLGQSQYMHCKLWNHAVVVIVKWFLWEVEITTEILWDLFFFLLLPPTKGFRKCIPLSDFSYSK